MAKSERDDYLRVGVITDTHGIRGEVKVYPTTEDPKRFELLPTVHIIAKDQSDVALKVCGVKYFKNLVILKFEGINNINDIEQYKKCEMFVTRADAIPLEEGEHYVADLIGLRVITDEGVELGVLEDVMETGANDVFDVRPTEGGKHILIPAIDQCMGAVDLDEGTMEVHLLPGLLDL
ncbi:MAG: ribosome maturation factor RimM [Lachnospiraceae bacterium]|nr:ribosome maturation factor RimM [Lachnospiraceae bacterium]